MRPRSARAASLRLGPRCCWPAAARCPTSRRAPRSTTSAPGAGAAAGRRPRHARRALPPITLAEIDAAARGSRARSCSTAWAMPTPTSCAPTARRAGALPPTQLLRQRLRDALAARRTVLGPDESGQHRAHRGPDARHCCASRSTSSASTSNRPARSVGLVRVRATLIRGGPGGDRVLGQRLHRAAPGARARDAAGGVKALTAASDAAVARDRGGLGGSAAARDESASALAPLRPAPAAASPAGSETACPARRPSPRPPARPGSGPSAASSR